MRSYAARASTRRGRRVPVRCGLGLGAFGLSVHSAGEEVHSLVGAALRRGAVAAQVQGPGELFGQLAQAAVTSAGGTVARVSEQLEGLGEVGTAVAAAAREGADSVAARLAESPSLAKLGHSTSAALQSASHLSANVGHKLGQLASAVDEPSSSAAASNASNAVHSAFASLSMAISEQPGALPLVAGGGGALLAIALARAVAVSGAGRRDLGKRVGQPARGDELPLRYDPDAIAAYFRRRPLPVIARSLRILAECSVLVAQIYIDRARGRARENELLRAKQMVDLITSLGPTAIKVGQALSIRPDLLPLAYLEELQTLQDRVPAFSSDEARAIILEGLGARADDVFSGMSPAPVAAASLGQVYKAKIAGTGETVAVKVQRPQVLEGISRDLYVLRIVAGLMCHLPNNHTDFRDVLDTWARRFFDELDYMQEGRNAIRFAEDMKALKNVRVPRVYMEYTSRKVLTTEWVEGEKLSDSRAGDMSTLVTTALNCYLIQLLETGFLHADPHPGNLLRTPDGRLCVLDFGLMTEVTIDQRYALIEYISHLVNEDYARVAEDLVVLGFVPPDLVDPEKTAAVVPQLAKVLGQLIKGGGARKVNVAEVTDELSRMAEDYVFVIPPYFALILRAFGVLEGIGLDNDPDYAIVDECYPYLSKRLITDDSPRARAALRYFLYGKGDRLDVARVENLAAGFQTFRDLMQPAPGTALALPASAASIQPGTVARRPPPPAAVDPAAKQALMLVFAPEGSFLQELLLAELVRAVDALSREAQAWAWAMLASQALLPLPAGLSTPGSWPLPLPGMVLGIVSGAWPSARLSAEDRLTLDTAKRIWTLLEPQLAAPSSAGTTQVPFDLFRDMAPGVTTAAQRFLVMLTQRQALRFADDLDGRNSVSEWEKDPAALARSIRPFRLFRRPRPNIERQRQLVSR